MAFQTASLRSALASGCGGRPSGFCEAAGLRGRHLMSLLWAGPDWQKHNWQEQGLRLEELTFHQLARGDPRKPCSFPRGQCPPALLHLGILASGWDFLYLGCPGTAWLHCSYLCRVSTLGQHGKGVCCSHLRGAPGWSLSYHLAGCTDLRERGVLRLQRPG